MTATGPPMPPKAVGAYKPPTPPISGVHAASGDNVLAKIPDTDDTLALPAQPLPVPPMPLPEQSNAARAELSQTNAQLLRRVRRMYIEKVIQNSERLAYDE